VDRDGQRNGPKALARLREDDPSRYVAAALGLVPKDWLIQIHSQTSSSGCAGVGHTGRDGDDRGGLSAHQQDRGSGTGNASRTRGQTSAFRAPANALKSLRWIGRANRGEDVGKSESEKRAENGAVWDDAVWDDECSRSAVRKTDEMHLQREGSGTYPRPFFETGSEVTAAVGRNSIDRISRRQSSKARLQQPPPLRARRRPTPRTAGRPSASWRRPI
jgi:hypothetical protein